MSQSAETACFDARVCHRRYLISWDIPWVGTLDVVHEDCENWSFERSPGTLELWTGPFYCIMGRDKTLRPKQGTRFAFLGLALQAAGWTEGHLWSLPFLG